MKVSGAFSRIMSRLSWICFTLAFIWLVVVSAVEFAFPSIRARYGWVEWESDFLWAPWSFFMIAVPLFFAGSSIVKAMYRRSIRVNGISSEAKILISHPDRLISDGLWVRFLLEVSPRDRRPFRFETETLISVNDMPRIQPGKSVLVKYDPNSNDAVLVWPKD
jgi:hypothetical protein